MLLGGGATTPSSRHVIIVVQLGSQLQGLIVDAVSDIVTIDRNTMQPPPDCGDTRTRSAIEGIVMLGDRMVMVLALSCIEAEQVTVPQAA